MWLGDSKTPSNMFNNKDLLYDIEEYMYGIKTIKIHAYQKNRDRPKPRSCHLHTILMNFKNIMKVMDLGYINTPKKNITSLN